MDAKAKAEEFFETIIKRKKSLIEIPHYPELASYASYRPDLEAQK